MKRSSLTMTNKEREKSAGTPRSAATSSEAGPQDPLADTRPLIAHEIPHGVDRRSFLMRTAVGGAAAVMTGCSSSPEEKTAKAVATATPSAAPSAAPSAPPLA